jgi:hypothetical protein
MSTAVKIKAKADSVVFSTVVNDKARSIICKGHIFYADLIDLLYGKGTTEKSSSLLSYLVAQHKKKTYKEWASELSLQEFKALKKALLKGQGYSTSSKGQYGYILA